MGRGLGAAALSVIVCVCVWWWWWWWWWPAGSMSHPTANKIYIHRTGVKFPPLHYDPDLPPPAPVSAGAAADPSTGDPAVGLALRKARHATTVGPRPPPPLATRPAAPAAAAPPPLRLPPRRPCGCLPAAQRPGAGPTSESPALTRCIGARPQVSVWVRLEGLLWVSERDQAFGAAVALSASWVDPRLRDPAAPAVTDYGRDEAAAAAARIWRPALALANYRGPADAGGGGAGELRLRVHSTGRVEMEERVVGAFGARMDTAAFPLDAQDLAWQVPPPAPAEAAPRPPAAAARHRAESALNPTSTPPPPPPHTHARAR